MPQDFNSDDLVVLKRSELQNLQGFRTQIKNEIEKENLSYLSNQFARAVQPTTKATHRKETPHMAMLGISFLIVGGLFALVGMFGSAQYNRGRESGLAAAQEQIMQANQQKTQAEAQMVADRQKLEQIQLLLGQ